MPRYRLFASTHDFVANSPTDALHQGKAMLHQGRYLVEGIERVYIVGEPVSETDPTTGIVHHGTTDS